jgi:ribonuclease D
MSDQEIQAVFPEYRPHSNRLDDLTKNLMGIELPKTNQASDWGKQQLSPDQLIYAAMDVAILPELTRKVKENASKLGLEKEIDLEIEKRKQQILNQVENAKQKNNDDSKRVIRALGRCRTKAELQRCLEVSKQMTILAENQSEVINIYKEKRNDLLT